MITLCFQLYILHFCPVFGIPLPVIVYLAVYWTFACLLTSSPASGVFVPGFTDYWAAPGFSPCLTPCTLSYFLALAMRNSSFLCIWLWPQTLLHSHIQSTWETSAYGSRWLTSCTPVSEYAWPLTSFLNVTASMSELLLIWKHKFTHDMRNVTTPTRYNYNYKVHNVLSSTDDDPEWTVPKRIRDSNPTSQDFIYLPCVTWVFSRY